MNLDDVEHRFHLSTINRCENHRPDIIGNHQWKIRLHQGHRKFTQDRIDVLAVPSCLFVGQDTKHTTRNRRPDASYICLVYLMSRLHLKTKKSHVMTRQGKSPCWNNTKECYSAMAVSFVYGRLLSAKPPCQTLPLQPHWCHTGDASAAPPQHHANGH